MARFMSFMVFLLMSAGTRDGPGRSYEETRELHDAGDVSVSHQFGLRA
jgi:hypothetical protein